MKTPADDSCWESETWTKSLKTDCVYRVGICFQRMERWEAAKRCFREYINLLLAGMNGSYRLEVAADRILEMQGQAPRRSEQDARDAFASMLNDAEVQSIQGKRRKLPKLSLAELLPT